MNKQRRKERDKLARIYLHDGRAPNWKAAQKIADIDQRCGARRKKDGLPCEALKLAGRKRCKWHGGSSTGPRTEEARDRLRAKVIAMNRSPGARERSRALMIARHARRRAEKNAVE